jgi:hypothetical protein
MFPCVEAALSLDELDDIGDALGWVRPTAPTHPHPNAANQSAVGPPLLPPSSLAGLSPRPLAARGELGQWRQARRASAGGNATQGLLYLHRSWPAPRSDKPGWIARSTTVDGWLRPTRTEAAAGGRLSGGIAVGVAVGQLRARRREERQGEQRPGSRCC